MPHVRNPVLIDGSLSRPAGAVFDHHGTVMRPAQDCSSFYGGAVTLCRIDSLNENFFSQTLVGHIYAGKFGCHTYNSQYGLEVIDVFGRVRGVDHVRAEFVPAESVPCLKRQERISALS